MLTGKSLNSREKCFLTTEVETTAKAQQDKNLCGTSHFLLKVKEECKDVILSLEHKIKIIFFCFNQLNMKEQ